MKSYLFYIGDYAARTRHLSWDEDLVLRKMLDLYYSTEKPLPLEVERVANLIRVPERLHDVVASVLLEFFVKTDEGWRNRRADKEIELGDPDLRDEELAQCAPYKNES